MSNLFNAPQSQRRIADLLKITIPEDAKTEEFLHFPGVKLSHDIDYIKAMIKNQIEDRVIQKVPLNKLVQVPLIEYCEEISEFTDQVTVEVPLDTDEYKTYKYIPSQISNPPDNWLIKQLVFFHLSGKDKMAVDKQHLMDVIDVAKRYAYCNGTLNGQCSRMKSIIEINKGGEIGGMKMYKASDYNTRISMQELLNTLNEVLPIQADSGVPPLTLNLDAYVVADDEKYGTSYIPKIKDKSLAGFPYFKKNKGETFIEGLATAFNFLTNVGPLTSEQIVQEYWPYWVYLTFPKAERYDIKKFDINTRNIWANSQTFHIIMNSAVYWHMKNSHLEISDDRAHSLQKFNPWYGNMDALMFRLLRNAQTGDYLVYADNIYLLINDCYYSIDLRRGESQATRGNCRVVVMYLVCCYLKQVPDAAVSKTWASVLLNIMPTACVDVITLFYEDLISIPGLASGSTLTFLVNHLTSTIFVAVWKKHGKPQPGTAEWDTMLEASQINVNIELTINNFSVRAFELMNSVSITPLADGTSYAKVLEMDMLGYDVIYDDEKNRFIPVLNETRALKSLIHPTKNLDKMKKDDNIKWTLTELVRLSIFYFCKGHSYGHIGYVIKTIVTEQINKLINAVQSGTALNENVSNLINDCLGEMGLDIDDLRSRDDSIESEGALQQVISLTDKDTIYRLNSPKGNPTKAVDLENLPKVTCEDMLDLDGKATFHRDISAALEERFKRLTAGEVRARLNVARNKRRVDQVKETDTDQASSDMPPVKIFKGWSKK